jgi:hypothetical protein
LFAVQIQPAESIGLLLDELLLHGGAVLKHVGADTGFGFGVGGGVGLRPTASAARRSVMAPERIRRAKEKQDRRKWP